jgi:hypothetical protein
MTELKIEGAIIQEFPEKTGTRPSGKTWRVKDYLVSYGDKYPKQVVLQAWDDIIDRMDVAGLVSNVTFHINLESPKNQKGYRNTTAKVWKLS